MGPTRAEVDLGAIARNVGRAKLLAGEAAEVMAVVKAEAYGHGLVPVARAALGAGAAWLGVANPDEAAPLRAARIRRPILVLGPIGREWSETVVRLGLHQCLGDPGQADGLARAAAAAGKRQPVHLKVDTGMGRVGVPPREARRAAEHIAGLPSLVLVGLMTHFADAEADDPGYAREQLRAFGDACRELAAAGIPVRWRHAANSGALLALPEARFDLVRPGILLYGCHPRGGLRPGDSPLAPALRLRTEIRQLKDLPRGATVSYGRSYVAPRDIRVATLPIGYADGVGRLLSNRGQVLIRGRRAPIIGRICMDMTLVDVTEVPEARVADEAVLIGRQGEEEITADEFAAWQGTISHEVLCRIGPRVPRVYRSVDAPEGAEGPAG